MQQSNMYNFIFDESGNFGDITHNTSRDDYVLMAGILVHHDQMQPLKIAADRLYLRYKKLDLEKFHLTEIRRKYKDFVDPVLREVKNILTNIGGAIYFHIDQIESYIEKEQSKNKQKKKLRKYLESKNISLSNNDNKLSVHPEVFYKLYLKVISDLVFYRDSAVSITLMTDPTNQLSRLKEKANKVHSYERNQNFKAYDKNKSKPIVHRIIVEHSTNSKFHNCLKESQFIMMEANPSIAFLADVVSNELYNSVKNNLSDYYFKDLVAKSIV